MALQQSQQTLATVRVTAKDTLLTELVIPFQNPTGHGEELLMRGDDPAAAGMNNGDYARVAATVVGFNRSGGDLTALGLPSSTNQLVLDGLPVSSLQLPRDATVMGRAGISSDALTGGYAGGYVNAGTIPHSFRELDLRITTEGTAAGVGSRTTIGGIPSVNLSIGSPLPAHRGGISILLNASSATLPIPATDSSDLFQRILRTGDQLGLDAWNDPARSRTASALATLMMSDVAGGVVTSMFRAGLVSSRGGANTSMDRLTVPGRQDGVDLALQNRWRRAWPWGRLTVSAGGTVERQRSGPLADVPGGWLDLLDAGGASGTRIPFGSLLPAANDRRSRLVKVDARFDRKLPTLAGTLTAQIELIGRDAAWHRTPTAGATLARVNVMESDARLLSTETARSSETAGGRAGIAALSFNTYIEPTPRVNVSLGGRLDVQAMDDGRSLGGPSTVFADVSPRLGFIASFYRRRRYVGELQVNAGRFVNWIGSSDLLEPTLSGSMVQQICPQAPPLRVPPLPPAGTGCAAAPESIVVRSIASGIRAPSTWRAGMQFRPNTVFRVLWPYVRLDLSRTDRLRTITSGNLAGGGLGLFSAADGRRVFAPPGAIDPATGLILPNAGLEARASGVQRIAGWDGVSEAAQLTFGAILLDLGGLQFNGSLTRAWGRQRIVGVADGSTNGVQAARWAPMQALPAYVSKVTVTSLFLPFEVAAFVEWTSGERFTPLFGTDVNGDGLANDAVGLGASAALDAAIRDQRCPMLGGVGVAPPNSCTTSSRLTTAVRFARTGSLGVLRRDVEVAVDLVNLFSLWSLVGGRGSGRLTEWEQGRNDPVAAFPVGFDSSSRRILSRPNPAFGAGSGAWRALLPTMASARVEVKVPFAASRSRQELERANAAQSNAMRAKAIAAIAERWYFDPVEFVLESPLGPLLADSTRGQLLQVRRTLTAEHAIAWRRLMDAQRDDAPLPEQERLRRQAEQRSRDAYEAATERIRAVLGADLDQAPPWLTSVLQAGASRVLIGFQPSAQDR